MPAIAISTVSCKIGCVRVPASIFCHGKSSHLFFLLFIRIVYFHSYCLFSFVLLMFIRIAYFHSYYLFSSVLFIFIRIFFHLYSSYLFIFPIFIFQENPLGKNVEIIRSNKGGMKLIHKGYMYTVHKRQSGGIRWRCSQRSLHCKVAPYFIGSDTTLKNRRKRQNFQFLTAFSSLTGQYYHWKRISPCKHGPQSCS